jgi:hypothetical protein
MNTNPTIFPRTLRMLWTAAIAALLAVSAAPSWAQKAYPTPEAAAEALIDGVARNDDDQVKTVLGADYRKYVPKREDHPDDTTNFLAAWAKAHRIVAAGSDKAWLGVGTHGWTLPIPIVKSAAGWSFDTKAAPEEMRTRRIGRNELAVINVVLAYTDAQEDYARQMRTTAGAPVYAQKLMSSPGKMDGLYWAQVPGEPESPLGPIVADVKPGEAYHGYRYKILTGQGSHAAGGAKSYVHDGKMVDGYALVAWPAKWGDTGVMTFIVDKDQVVYQKDLGPKTDEIARAMTRYDPDSTWQKVPAPAP